MSAMTRSALKAVFENNDTPTGNDFANLIDSCVNIVDSTTQTINSNLVINGLLATNSLLANSINTQFVDTSGVNVNGSSAFFGILNYSSDSSAIAAGTNQSTATLLTRALNRFVTVATGAGAILPSMGSSTEGPEIFIFNDTIVNLNIYPPSGGFINALSTNSPYVVSASVRVSFYGFQLTSYFTK